MRQVPKAVNPHYLIIGNGRVARHFQHYFTLLHLPFQTWQRREPLTLLHDRLKMATHVLLAIADKAIDEFMSAHLQATDKICVHFSGSVVSAQAYGAHPLMGFNQHLYDLQQYQSFTFVVDHDAPDFSILLPGFPNQHVRLQTSLKAKYHALCVLAGNFSCMLWQKLFSTFEKEFAFSSHVAMPYLLQQTNNIQVDYQSALTGPLVRRDEETIQNNLNALKHDPFKEIYESFVACYQKINEETA